MIARLRIASEQIVGSIISVLFLQPPFVVRYFYCHTSNMADKEATIYIVDVGSSMGKKCNGRQESNLDWAMNYVWEKITSTV